MNTIAKLAEALIAEQVDFQYDCTWDRIVINGFYAWVDKVDNVYRVSNRPLDDYFIVTCENLDEVVECLVGVAR